MRFIRLRLNIQQKIQVLVLATTLIVFAITIAYISWRSHETSLHESKSLIDINSSKSAQEIEKILNKDFAVIRTLAQAFVVHKNMEVDEWKALFNEMYHEVFVNNPHFHSLWDSWEFSYYDPEWTLPHGRHLSYFHRKDGKIIYEELIRSLEGDPALYGAAKKAGKETIWEPYLDRIATEGITAHLMTTMTVPMFVDNKYIGLVGLDITLKSLQDIIYQVHPYEESYAFIVSNKGMCVAHPVTNYLEQPISSFMPDDVIEQQIIERIQKGEVFSYMSNKEHEEKYYYSYTPIYIGQTDTPWSICIAVPNSQIREAALNNLIISIIIGIIGIIIISIIISLISTSISKPIKKTTELMKRIALGQLDESMLINIQTGDEIEEMSKAFNTSIAGFINKTEFASNIGRGNMDSEIKLLSADDKLGQALLDMQNHLKHAREDEQLRKIEEDKRNWITQGLAKFSDILRLEHGNIEKLSFIIIQNLVNYLNANQGGLFILEDSDKEDIYLEMKACYAYDRQKFIDTKIKIGEGLVGACYLEKKPIYLTQIPDTYTKIASGLGEDSPNSLLIVPLKSNDDINGVIEIASFNKFEDYQIEFVEKVSESIASTIANAKIAARTSQLLEQSQQQAEEMKAQEEEMRQNMEELAATQEEMARKTSETEGIIKALEASSYTLEYDNKGYIQNISDSYCSFLGVSKQDCIGKHHSYKVEFTDDQKKEYDQFWDDLRNGRIRKQKIKVNIDGKIFHLVETYAPITDSFGSVVKIFKIANDITDSTVALEKMNKEYSLTNSKLNVCIKEKEKLMAALNKFKKS